MQSRFIEAIISNSPSSIITQQRLVQLGYIPLGVIPGTMQQNATIHYGKLKPELIPTIPNIHLANDYQETSIESLSKQLWVMWKNK